MTFGYEPLPGGAELGKDIEAIEGRANDLEPAFLAIVESFHAIEAKRFEDNGPGWLPLSDATIANRQRPGHNPDTNQILRDTGALYEAATGGNGSYVIMTPDTVEVGISGAAVPYAHWHQTGGTRLHASGAGWPPQRKIVEADEALAAEWAGIVFEYVMFGEHADAAV